MSKEHAWPRWLGRGADVEPEQRTHRSGFGRSDEDSYYEHLNVATIKPGSVLTARIREVCADCNNGWMSLLEQRTRPLLTRLWTPDYPLGLTWFPPAEATALSAWATKTAWTRERVTTSQLTAKDIPRRELMGTLQPPPLTSVWFARHDGELNFTSFETTIETAHREERWNDSRSRRVHVCVLVFRGLAVLVRTDSGDGVPEMPVATRTWRQFWPTLGGVVWPPPDPLTDSEAHMTGRYVRGWLDMPNVAHFERAPGWREVRRN